MFRTFRTLVAKRAATRLYQSAQRPPEYIHGPWFHIINKGGLKNIIEDGVLLATPASPIWGGGPAVRALDENPGSDGKPVIMFYTKKAPDKGTAPGLLVWRDYEGAPLEIYIVAIFGNTEGHL